MARANYTILILILCLFAKNSHSQSSLNAQGSVILGHDTRTCDASIEGTLRYTGGALASSVTSGLMGYWKLDESAGSTAADSSGNSNDGSYTGTADALGGVGILGRSLNVSLFSGGSITNEVSVPSSSDFGSLNSMTIAFWVSPSETWPNLVRTGLFEILGVFKVGTDSVGQITLWASAWSTTEGQWPNSGVSIPNDKSWHHIAITYNPAAGTGDIPVIYLDGNPTTSSTTGGQTPVGTWSPAGSSSIRFGNMDETCICNAFEGDLDDVRVYNRVLTSVEVESLYRGTVQVCTDKLGSYQWTVWGDN